MPTRIQSVQLEQRLHIPQRLEDTSISILGQWQNEPQEVLQIPLGQLEIPRVLCG